MSLALNELNENVLRSNQCWSGINFFLYHLGIYKNHFTFCATNRVWVFEDIFVFDIIWVYISSKSLHT